MAMGQRDTTGEGLTEVKRMSEYYTLNMSSFVLLTEDTDFSSGIGTVHQDGREPTSTRRAIS